MTNHDDVAQRAYHSPDPDRIEVRDVDDPEDGLMTIRMPISSTAEARDGDAFGRDRLEGWAEQIRDGSVPAFLDHGHNMDVSGSRYSSTGKVGYLADPELEERDDGETDLVVDNVLMDPETLPSATGGLREALARIKSQVERDIPLTSSVGWSDNTGDRDVPGGSDLLENSLVGIPSDPSASSHEAAVAQARDVLEDHDLDEEAAEELVADFRAAVMGPDERDEHDMSDEETESPGDESGDDRDGQDDISAGEFREQMLEMQRSQTETLNTLSDALRADDEDEDEDEDEEEESEDEDEDDDDDEDRLVTIGDEEMTADEAVDKLRDRVEGAKPETPGDDDDDRDEEPDEERTADPKNLL